MTIAILPFRRDGDVARVIGMYLDRMKQRYDAGEIDKTHWKRARYYGESFSSKCGHLAIEQCEQSDLEDWIADNPQWASAYTRSDAMGVIVSCFRWAAERAKKTGVKVSPFRRNAKVVGKQMPRNAIRKSEYRALHLAAKSCDGRGPHRKLPSSSVFRLAIFFLWRTGCRTCEMREAKWLDLDFTTGVIVLFEHKTARSTGQARLIALDEHLLYVLRRVHEARHKPAADQHIFLTSRGRPWAKDFSKIFRQYAQLAKIRPGITGYSMRHGAAIDLVDSGASDRETADFLGHRGTRNVQRYISESRQNLEHLKRIQAMRRKKRWRGDRGYQDTRA